MSAYVGHRSPADRAGESHSRRGAQLLAAALSAIAAALAALAAAHLFTAPGAALPRTGVTSLSRIQRLPLPLRAQLSVAEGAAPAYRVTTAPDGTLQARGGGITARFSRRGVALSDATHASVTLAPAQVSDAGTPVALSEPLPHAHGDRVEYARGPVEEWYANGPGGVEQGFTIARGTPGRLTIALASSGVAQPRMRGGSVELGGSLRYGALSAVDAVGRPLPSRLSVRGGQILLEVEAAGARFPVRIDPFVFEQTVSYAAHPSIGETSAGSALSANGNTAVIGASTPAPGAVYVFQRGADGLWALHQTISPGGTDAYAFGSHVALSEEGTTMLVSAETSSNLGRIWTYTLHEGVWSPDATTLSDPIKTNPPYDHDKPGFQYGNALALSGDGSRALVADEPQGAAVVYERKGGEWIKEASFSNGKSEPSEYGIAVALSSEGRTVLVAAPNAELVYAYREIGGKVWEQQGTFPYFAYDGQRNVAVAVSREGTTALSGEYLSGTARVWVREAGTWVEQAKLTEPVGPGEQEFGSDVSLSASGSKAMILAFGGEGVAAYEYTRSGSIWSQQGAPIEAPIDSEFRSIGYIPEVVLSAQGHTALLWSKFEEEPQIYTDTPALGIDPAGELGTTSAMLKGTVNPAGETVTTCRFEYGTSLSYGSTKACASLPSGSAPVAVAASISGLTSGTSYHYRLQVTTAAGTFDSSDGTFTTLAALATAKTEEPSKPATATLGSVSATASGGTGTVAVGAYGSNVGEPPLPSSTGGYLDVYRSTTATFKEVEVKACEIGNAKALWAYGKEGWEPVSPAAVLSGGCLVFNATPTSRPSVTELEGFRYKMGEPAGRFGECRAAKDSVYSEGACLSVHESGGHADGKGKYEWYSAVPGVCFPQKKGEFSESACRTLDQKKGKPAGKYELLNGAFTAVTGAVTLEAGTEKVECTSGTGAGELSSPEKGSETLTLEGCAQKGTTCSSAGASAGTIVSFPLEVIVLQGAEGGEFEQALAAAQFASFSCGKSAFAIEGAAVGPLTGAVNVMSSTTKASFMGAGSQLIDLSGSNEIPAKLSMNLTTTSRQPLEVDTALAP